MRRVPEEFWHTFRRRTCGDDSVVVWKIFLPDEIKRHNWFLLGKQPRTEM